MASTINHKSANLRREAFRNPVTSDIGLFVCRQNWLPYPDLHFTGRLGPNCTTANHYQNLTGSNIYFHTDKLFTFKFATAANWWWTLKNIEGLALRDHQKWWVPDQKNIYNFFTWCQGKMRSTGLFSNHDKYWVSKWSICKPTGFYNRSWDY